MGYNEWLEREKAFNLILHRTIDDAIRSIERHSDDVDSIDAILEVLAVTLVNDMERYLSNECEEAYEEGLDGKAQFFSIEDWEIYDYVYAEIDDQTFADRIHRYIDDLRGTALFNPESLDDGVSTIKHKLDSMAAIDGHRVRNEALQLAGEDLNTLVGYTVTKRWRSMRDDRVRDTHEELEGVTIPINEYFYTENGRALHPGGFNIPQEDCGCRCEIQIITEVEE